MRDHNDIEEVPSIELTDHDLMAVTGGTFGYTAMQLAARSAVLWPLSSYAGLQPDPCAAPVAKPAMWLIACDDAGLPFPNVTRMFVTVEYRLASATPVALQAPPETKSRSSRLSSALFNSVMFIPLSVFSVRTILSGGECCSEVFDRVM
jgi:hypothetical protein